MTMNKLLIVATSCKFGFPKLVNNFCWYFSMHWVNNLPGTLQQVSVIHCIHICMYVVRINNRYFIGRVS